MSKNRLLSNAELVQLAALKSSGYTKAQFRERLVQDMIAMRGFVNEVVSNDKIVELLTDHFWNQYNALMQAPMPDEND